MDWWWALKGKNLRSHSARSYIEKHLRGTLGPLPLREVTSARIQRLLADKVGALSPKSLNDLRAFVFNFFQVAKKPGGPWEGRANPVEDVERFKVTPRPKKVLAVDEFELVLSEVPRRWEGPVATGLYAGLREGEIFGLQKEDVDLDAGILMVWRSWEANRTKDGKALPVPIADQLRPRIAAALQSPGHLLFPRRDGSMQPSNLRLGRMLRAAIARAGLIEGWLHRCRAPGCHHEVRSQKATPPERCSQCGKPTVWAKAIPRHVTFHGTRHSFGTAVVRGAGTAVAQKALRHSDVRLTIHTYGHLDDRDLRDGIASAFGSAAAGPPTRTPGASAVRTGTAGELRARSADVYRPTETDVFGTENDAQQPVDVEYSEIDPARTDARTARSAASARTRCSSAA
jgi:integrase